MLQYEELRKIIKGKKKGLADFSQALKNLRYPVGEFPMIVSITNYDIADKQVILLKTNLLCTDKIPDFWISHFLRLLFLTLWIK